MLTQKQYQLLMFIQERLSQAGVSPSFEEMKEALELRSKSGVHRLITALEERGFIRRLPHRARALEVLKLPDEHAASVASSAPPARRSTPLSDRSGRSAGQTSSSLELPVLGRIAAGTPIEAIQHEVDRMPIPDAFVGTGDHYILEVQGESMIEAGIHDGDFAIIKECANPIAGEIVVALVDGEEATLKTFRKNGSSVALEAANPAFETRVYEANRVSFQGQLVGLMRRYS